MSELLWIITDSGNLRHRHHNVYYVLSSNSQLFWKHKKDKNWQSKQFNNILEAQQFVWERVNQWNNHNEKI